MEDKCRDCDMPQAIKEKANSRCGHCHQVKEKK